MTKIIKGNAYYYYQDSVKSGDKNEIITTYIGRSKNNFDSKKEHPLQKHFFKMYAASGLISDPSYHFENKPTIISTKVLELYKFQYNQFINLLGENEKEDFQNTLFVRYVYGTTAIEGNTISEDEAEKLLAIGLTPNNKTLNETLEVANYNDLRDFTSKYKGEVTQKFIQNIHRLLIKGIRTRNGMVSAGEYRTDNVRIAGAAFQPIPPDQIEERMYYLIKEQEDNLKNNIHPVEVASIFHQKFEEIHPFQDGNGRVGREILNYMLQKNKFSPIYIPPTERGMYLDALEKGNQYEFVSLLDFIIRRMSASLVYLVAKTRLYDVVVSNGYKKFFAEIAGEDQYNSYISDIKKVHDNKINP